VTEPERSLEAWLRARLDAGEIKFIEHRDGMAIYQMVTPVNIDEID
jgi:aspartyl/asparaginyl-tRNA synthetase